MHNTCMHVFARLPRPATKGRDKSVDALDYPLASPPRAPARTLDSRRVHAAGISNMHDAYTRVFARLLATPQKAETINPPFLHIMTQRHMTSWDYKNRQ